MKRQKQLSLIGLVTMLVLTSCTIQKKVHSFGYHVERINGKHSSNLHLLVKKCPILKSIKNQIETASQFKSSVNLSNSATILNDPPVIASIDNSVMPALTIPNDLKYFSVLSPMEDCDNIILINGNEINGKVLEITTDEIKYKKCDNINGPTYSLKKSEVFMIIYPTGTKDIITPNNSISTSKVDEKSQLSNSEKNQEALLWHLSF